MPEYFNGVDVTITIYKPVYPSEQVHDSVGSELGVNDWPS